MLLPVNYDNIDQSTRRLVREEYVKLQEGKCYFCNTLLTEVPDNKYSVNRKLFPINFFKWPVHLHHNHNTGMTIGAVHAVCNAVLWQHYGE